MRKFTEHELYNVFSDLLKFMNLKKAIYDYALCENNKLLATDGMRLIIKHFPLSDDTFSIHKTILKEACKKFSRKRKTLIYNIHEDSENLYIDDFVIKKEEPTFPDWKSVYPKLSLYPTEIDFKKSKILNIVKTFPKVNKLKELTFLVMTIERKVIKLKMVNKFLDLIHETFIDDFDFDIISLEKDTVNICMNFQFFIDALSVCDELITLMFRDVYHPIYITDEKTFRYIRKHAKTEMLIMGCVEEKI